MFSLAEGLGIDILHHIPARHKDDHHWLVRATGTSIAKLLDEHQHVTVVSVVNLAVHAETWNAHVRHWTACVNRGSCGEHPSHPTKQPLFALSGQYYLPVHASMVLK